MPAHSLVVRNLVSAAIQAAKAVARRLGLARIVRYFRASALDRQRAMIAASGLFDAAWYVEKYPDAAATGMDPLAHFLLRGGPELRDPGPRFSTLDYVHAHPDVIASGLNPLVHFLMGLARSNARRQPSRSASTTATTGAAAPAELAYEAEQFPQLGSLAVKLIAYYLPQFHPIPQNNRWWGRGFTEWTNVTRAQPLFPGHYQPHLPGELGFYDLRLPEVMQRQVELAQQYGLHGFCFYYYRFDGERLLEKPLDMFLAHPEWKLPFCLCWANENWTRRWDGREHEVLMAQKYSAADDLGTIRDLARYIRDERYIRVDGKPLVVVYRPQALPDPKATAERWRTFCREEGIGEILLMATQTVRDVDPQAIGFDGVVAFPPLCTDPESATDAIAGLAPGFRGSIWNYASLREKNPPQPAPFVKFNGVMTAWDNTARRGLAATIFANATPAEYQRWLESVLAFACEQQRPAERIVFVNAWNEWAEGAHLEPDARHGYAYLNATARALENAARLPGVASTAPNVLRRMPTVAVVVPAYKHAAFVARALDSIRQQDLPCEEIELLVIDDGSPDNTADIVEAYLKEHRFPHARLVRQTNSGAHAAINRGIRATTAPYVTILNSDDEYHPARLSTLLAALRKSGQALCFSDFEAIDEASVTIAPQHPYVERVRSRLRRIESYPNLSYSLFHFNATISTGNLLFTRELFDRIGGFASYRYCHDWDFALKSLQYTTPIRIEQPLYRYRLHGSNTFESLGMDVGGEESRALLAGILERVFNSSMPGEFPSLNAPLDYLANLMQASGVPIPARHRRLAA